MIITADISMYPLDADFIEPITRFIVALREYSGLDVVTNQLSTQVRGEFDVVAAALNDCMHNAMSEGSKVVFVTKYLNSDLDIAELPQLD